MHDTVRVWVAEQVQALGLSGRVLEQGSANVNGGVRDLIPHTRWCGIDIAPGADVDVIGDCSTVEVEPGTWDVVVTTGTLEHVDCAAGFVENAYKHLKPGGWYVVTAAGEGFHRHGARGQGSPPPGEPYENVTAPMMTDWLEAAGFTEFRIWTGVEPDFFCVARKGGVA